MKLLYPLGGEDSAIHAYRHVWPGLALEAKGHMVTTFRLDRMETVPMGDIVRHADIVHHHITQNWSENHYFKKATVIQNTVPRVTMNMEFSGPAAFVVDVDDAVFHVDILNPAFGLTGVYDHEGKYLPPGAIINGKMPTGETKVLFQDMKPIPQEPDKKFSLALNRHRSRQLVWAMEQYAGVTCSTERMKKYIGRWTRRQDAFVMPNCVYPKMYPPFEVPQADRPRILYQGGSSHYHDIQAIYEPLIEVLKRNPEAQVIIFGQQYKWLTDALPKDQSIFVDWVPFPAYHATLRTLGHNINLCPLRRDYFSEHKSCIKWYEASALHNPVATLASNAPPFSDEMVDGETGLLYDGPEEFAQKLERLIKDPQLRKTLAHNAHEWVWRNRDEALWVPKLEQYYESLVKSQYDRALRRHAVTV